MILKVRSTCGNIPQYATEGSSGMDVAAYTDKPIVLHPMERMLIPTGLFVEIPEGCEGQIRARSGLAVNYGITLINGIGTIDSDYRGELKIPLINLGTDDFIINSGDRIAQLIICRYEKVEVQITESLASSARGEGGFGHTGISADM